MSTTDPKVERLDQLIAHLAAIKTLLEAAESDEESLFLRSLVIEVVEEDAEELAPDETPMDRTNYLLELQRHEAHADHLLTQHRPRVDAWTKAAQEAGWPQWKTIDVLREQNGWDQDTADLRDKVIPREIQRVQRNGTPLPSAAGFAPVDPPTLPDPNVVPTA